MNLPLHQNKPSLVSLTEQYIHKTTLDYRYSVHLHLYSHSGSILMVYTSTPASTPNFLKKHFYLVKTMRRTEYFKNQFNIDSKGKNKWKFLYCEATFFMSSLKHSQQYEKGVREGKISVSQRWLAHWARQELFSNFLIQDLFTLLKLTEDQKSFCFSGYIHHTRKEKHRCH